MQLQCKVPCQHYNIEFSIRSAAYGQQRANWAITSNSSRDRIIAAAAVALAAVQPGTACNASRVRISSRSSFVEHSTAKTTRKRLSVVLAAAATASDNEASKVKHSRKRVKHAGNSKSSSNGTSADMSSSSNSNHSKQQQHGVHKSGDSSRAASPAGGANMQHSTTPLTGSRKGHTEDHGSSRNAGRRVRDKDRSRLAWRSSITSASDVDQPVRSSDVAVAVVSRTKQPNNIPAAAVHTPEASLPRQHPSKDANSKRKDANASIASKNTNLASRRSEAAAQPISRTAEGNAGTSRFQQAMRATGSPVPKARRGPPGSSRFKQGSKRNAALYNIKLRTFAELQQLVQQYGTTASLDDLMAMFSRTKAVRADSLQDKTALLDQLWRCLQPRLKQEASIRHCTEAMLAASKLHHAPEGLYQHCLEAFLAHLQQAERDMPAKEFVRVLGNCIYAVGTAPMQQLNQQPGGSQAAFTAAVDQRLLPAFMRHLHAATPQAVSLTVYAAALLGCSSFDVQQLLAKAPPTTWQLASTQEVGITLYGAAVLGQQLAVQQLQQLLGCLISNLGAASSQHIINSLWGVATLGHRLPQAQLQKLVAAAADKCDGSRTAATALWCVAKLGERLPQQQIDQFVTLLLTADGQAGNVNSITPQSISNSLWAIATMKRSIKPQQFGQLLAIHLQQLQQPETSLQCIANILWAAANLRLNIDTDDLEAIFTEFVAKMQPAFAAHNGSAEPQAFSNAIWAAASLHPPFLPRQLLVDPVAVKFIVDNVIPRMKLQEYSNIILACGMLGLKETKMLKPLIAAAAAMLPEHGTSASTSRQNNTSGNSSINASSAAPESSTSTAGSHIQAWCNIGWAATVLNLQSMAPTLLRLAAECARLHNLLGPSDKVQLWQLHMWMTDSKCYAAGLSEVFSAEQLQEYRAAWSWLVESESRASGLQEQVFTVVQQLPILQDAVLEARTPDGLVSADIMATGPQGQQVVIEVDGPYHYRRPDNALTGTTRFRNRALAARGYIVVAIPWWEWNRCQNTDEQIAYLQQKVQQSWGSTKAATTAVAGSMETTADDEQ